MGSTLIGVTALWPWHGTHSNRMFWDPNIPNKKGSIHLMFCQYVKDFFTEISHSFVHSDAKDSQGSHRLEKYLNLDGFLEKSLKIESALKSTGNALKSIEKSLISTIFCRT